VGMGGQSVVSCSIEKVHQSDKPPRILLDSVDVTIVVIDISQDVGLQFA
jgi:hypothetical protein